MYALATVSGLLNWWWLDFAAQDLAGRTGRKTVYDPDPARVLVGGYTTLDKVTQLHRVGRCIALQNHCGTDLFTE
jgi:hypothetical protein